MVLQLVRGKTSSLTLIIPGPALLSAIGSKERMENSIFASSIPPMADEGLGVSYPCLVSSGSADLLLDNRIGSSVLFR